MEPPVEAGPVAVRAPRAAPKQAAAQRKNRRAYSVTFSHTERRGAKRPADLSRLAFADLLKQRHQEVFLATSAEAAAAEADVAANVVIKVMVFHELHADGNVHAYAMVLANRPYACEPIRRLLAQKDQVNVMFGTSHAYWWTGVVYGAVPTVHKALEEIDTEPYHSEGLTVREELMDMPRGARFPDKERVRAFLGVPAAKKGSAAQARLGKEELAEMIRNNSWRTRASICEAAKKEKAITPLSFSFGRD